MGKAYRLERSQTVPRPRPEIFAFFCDAANLGKITPPFVGFEMLTRAPLVIGEGTLIDYKIRLYGIPVRWQTRIETFEQGVAFTDIQLKGPYRRWHHRHTFTDVPGGTRMDDVVDYEMPLGVLGRIAHALFVARSLEQIFEYRRKVMADMFGAPR